MSSAVISGRMSDSDRKEIILLKSKWLSYRAIGRQTGWSYSAVRYIENKEHCLEVNYTYRHTEAGRITARNAEHKRRERKEHGAGITVKDVEGLWKGQDGKCFYCGCPMRTAKDFNGPIFIEYPYLEDDYCTLDHVVPLSRGGKHEIENIVLACRKCNIKKGTRRIT